MKEKKLTIKDICLVIATYNRSEDLNLSLKSLIKNNNIFGGIIIVDQSKDSKTKEIVNSYKNKIPIKYLYCSIPSADISMNQGIKEAIKKFKLILTAGDDVDFLENYGGEIIKEFNRNPKVMAIGGVDINQNINYSSFKEKLANFIFKIFLLPYHKKNKFKITGPYGHTIDVPTQNVYDAQWIPGFNTCWRAEIYPEGLWLEIRGYNVIDDLDSSYKVYKKYGKGSLLISTKCKTRHRHTETARYVERKRIYVNHEDHFSFYYLYFNNFIGTLKLSWELFGIIFGNILRMIIKPNKNNKDSLKYNLEAIYYSFNNRKNIKKKNFRKFLDKSLNMNI